MSKLQIEVSGLPDDVLEKHKHSIVSSVEDQVENIVIHDSEMDEEVDFDDFVTWDVVDG